MLHTKILKYILLTFFSLFFFNTAFGQFKSHIKLEINELKYKNGNLIVNYNINNTKPNDKIRVWIDVFDSKNDTIFAKSWSGNINKLHEGGENKLAIWNIFKDKIEVFDSITVKLSATVENRFYLDNPFILSTIYPGWGDYKIRRRKSYWIYGAISYGLLGSSLGMYYNSFNNYNNYLDANSIADKDKYFKNARTSKTISYALLGTAGLVWAIDYIGLLKRTKQIKKQRKKNYQIKETPEIPNLKIVTAVSNKKFVNTRLTNLEVVEGSEKYIDLDANNCLDAFEKGNIEFELFNKGPAPAVDFYVSIEKLDTSNKVLLPKEFLINRIPVGKSRKTRIPIKVGKDVKTGLIKFKIKISAKKNIPIEPFLISVPSMAYKYKDKIHSYELISDVDKNIPKLPSLNKKFALIIGNEGYANEHTGLSYNFNVSYARNDAIVFKKYAINILGIKEENIIFKLDANVRDIKESIEALSLKVKNAGKGSQLLFYYAGHGMADTISKAPYIMPIDIAPENFKDAISLEFLYNNIWESRSKKSIVIFDASFNNGSRNIGLRGSSAKKIDARSEMIQGYTVVFSAAIDAYTANSYNEKKHGLYTYLFLKKLKETKGDIELFNLSNDLKKEMELKDIENDKIEQKCGVEESIAARRWKKWKIR